MNNKMTIAQCIDQLQARAFEACHEVDMGIYTLSKGCKTELEIAKKKEDIKSGLNEVRQFAEFMKAVGNNGLVDYCVYLQNHKKTKIVRDSIVTNDNKN